MIAYNLTKADLENSALSRKAEKAGYASLKSLLNDHDLWSKDTSEIEAFLNRQILEMRPVIEIVSGEGEIGITQPYQGPRTKRALLAHLKCERCNGDRWARAQVRVMGELTQLDPLDVLTQEEGNK